MTSQSSLAVLLDPAWHALGTDSLATNARKALIAAGVTPDAAASMPRPALASVPGLGKARLEHVEAYLARLAEARAAHAAAEAADVAREAGKSKPGHCPDCGDPHATEPRNVTADIRGCLRHVSQPGAPIQPWCDSCHEHHRALLGQLVDA